MSWALINETVSELLEKFQNIPILLDVSRVEYERKNKAFATLQTLPVIGITSDIMGGGISPLKTSALERICIPEGLKYKRLH
jgi:hypothetical protein